MLMFMGIEQVGGCPCPHNLLFVRDDMTVHMRLMSIERYLGLAVAAAVVLVLALRWRLASPPLRRALFPILVSGGVAIGLVAATLLASSLPYTGAPIKLQSAERLAFGVVPIAYLVGLFRARMGRVGVSDLIVELGRGLEPGRLRDAIARSLRDPSLELGYWIRDPDEYVDVDGSPVSVVPTAGRAVTILERHGRKVAALVHDPALSEDPALLDAVSSAAGLALENERLLAELRAQLDEVRDSRARIVEAGVTERRRLERNLHDGAQQRLVTLSLHLRMAQETLHDDPPAAEAMLEGVGDDLKQALEELRELARGLHPAVLTDRGLAPALQSLANRSPFPVADRRCSRAPATRSSRSGPLLRRRGKPHQRREALRSDRRARRAVDDPRDGRGRDPRQRKRRREPDGRHRASRTRRPRRGARRGAPGSELPAPRNGHTGRAATALSELARSSRSPPDRELDAAEGARRAGKQRLLVAAQESVEEGEQIGTFGRECRGPVDVPDQSSDARRAGSRGSAPGRRRRDR